VFVVETNARHSVALDAAALRVVEREIFELQVEALAVAVSPSGPDGLPEIALAVLGYGTNEGLAVTGQKTWGGAGRSPASFSGRLHGPRFLPEGLGLDGLGVADPNLLK
jgi:hypothetical protein